MKAERMPFADGEFDVASAIEVLEHVPDPEHTVAEMARVASGHLLVSVPREPLWRGLNMARRLPGVAGHVEPAPEPLARHGDRRVPGGDARHLRDGVLRVGHVLEASIAEAT